MGMFIGLVLGGTFMGLAGLVVGAYASNDVKYIIGKLFNK
jgi:hypothetical protein